MMLTVHGLPIKTKFQDVKALIKQECNIPDFILDNLVDDGYDSKKVRIGLTNENDGYRLMKCLDGFRMSGSHVLKVVPIGKPPTPQTFEPRSGYSNQPRNDYPKESLPDYSSRNDYNRGQPSTNNPSSHISPRDSARNIGMDTRVHVAQSDRGLLDSRQSLSQAMSDSRSQQDRYQGSLDRPALDTRGPQATDSRGPTDFRNPSRGLLAPPAIRPASMDARGPMLDSRGQHGPLESGGTHGPLESAGPHGPHGIRGHDGPLNYRGSLDHRQVSNPESIRQPQWTSAGGNDQWSAPNRPMQNQNVGYNYQQPQGNTGYGQQPSNSQPAAYTQGRAPLTQGYQQPKIDAPDRPVTRPHVLRSVELVDSPIQPRAPPSFPPHQKPITIMKENFQGPTQYNVTGQVPQSQGPYQSQAQAAWAQQGQGQTKQLAYDKSYDERRLAMDKPQAKLAAPPDYEKRRFSPPRGRPASPERGRGVPTNTARPVDPYAERRVSPPRPFTSDRRSPGRHIASISTDFSASGRRMSPSKVAPTGRRISPTRKLSPRRVSSPGRRVSPPGSGRRISPFARNISPNRKIVGRPISPSRTGRRISPPGIGRRVSPPGIGRRISPPGIGRRISPPGIGRRISPSGTGRRISPFGRKISPIGQRTSPGRHISQTGRRISPGSRISPRRGISPGRRISPSGRRVSPTGGRVSPTGRRISPTGRRISPPGKRGSPVRRDEPRRMSPSMTKYDYYVEDERRGGRLESPRRYSPKRSPLRSSGRYSPSEIKYECDDAGSKGSKPIRPAYEPNQGQKYTGAGFRPNETQYPASASRNDAKISPWQNDKITYPIKKEEREIHRMSRSDAVEKKLSPRRSRSRSPVKDRYRRHSPSPRSPRRSWALEKRRSPDATREPPPPPLWPGQESEDKPKHPVWERNNPDEDRRFDDKSRDEKYTPRFSPRREIDDRREYRDELKFESNYRPEDRDDYRRESLHHDDKKLLKEVDKDFNDIYQRAVEFRRKTEELRKSNDRRNRSYDEEEIKEITPPPADRLTKSKPNWIPIKIQTKDLYRKKLRLDPSVKDKRDKAVEEIACRILEPHHFNGEQKQRIMEELKFCIYNIMLEMFKDKDVSYIELVIKFRARYDAKDEEKILLDVLKSMPSHYKDQLKRKGEGITEVPSKVSRRAPDNSKKEPSRPLLSDSIIPDWNMSIEPPKVLSMPLTQQIVPPVMVQPPLYVPAYQVQPQMYQANLQAKLQATQMQTHMQSDSLKNMREFQSNMQEIQARMQTHIQAKMQSQTQLGPIVPEQDEGHNLYLCQDDFEPFSDNQAEKLKQFLVSKMFQASETGDGWAPDFALKGLHSMYRYELSTKDDMSKNWIVNLDFSDFEYFNVLVYTKEELWYERAAIWLPGHSRYRNIEPLEKLRLQNQYADVGINIGKWKFVKKIVTAKGTRLYVDMPPSSARALEKQKMMLSYELGKVNVYLKAVAVDKEVFDAGLKAPSITDPSQLATVLQSSVMPTLSNQQVGLVKVTLNGSKSITIQQAGKLKEMIVYNLFKFHQQGGKSKTDFVKYGFCPPNCIGLVPENTESKKWLLSRSLGKLNRQLIVVVDGEDANTKYFRMRLTVPLCRVLCAVSHQVLNMNIVMERLKNSNQGVKGLHFHYWKPISFSHEPSKGIIDVDIDLESTETLIKMKFKLDYVNEDHQTTTARFKSDYSLSKLEEKIRKYKAEQVDSYDVANMELDSDSD